VSQDLNVLKLDVNPWLTLRTADNNLFELNVDVIDWVAPLTAFRILFPSNEDVMPWDIFLRRAQLRATLGVNVNPMVAVLWIN